MKSIHGAADGVQGGDVSHRARLVAARDDTKPGIKAGKTQQTPVDQSYRRFTLCWCQCHRTATNPPYITINLQTSYSQEVGLDSDVRLLMSFVDFLSYVCTWVLLFTC